MAWLAHIIPRETLDFAVVVGCALAWQESKGPVAILAQASHSDQVNLILLENESQKV